MIRFGMILLVTGAVGARLDAQSRMTLREDDQCRTCRIEVTKSIAMGDADGPGTIDHSESVALRDSRGNFVVRGSYSTALKVFDRSGRFLRTIGRQGEGPGEFKGIGTFELLGGDTLAVFDWGTSRVSLFSADHKYLSSAPLPLTPESGAIALANGEFVFAKTIYTSREIGQPLHRVSRDGKLALSFGSATGVFRPDIPYLLSRAIGRSRGTRLWSALRTNYQIDLLDARQGVTVSSFTRDVSWFPPGMVPVPRGGGEDVTPKPFIYDVEEDANGLLWVLIAVPDPDWRKAVKPAGGGDHGTVTDDHGFRDMVIEVIDPARGTVLASTRMKERITQFIGAGMLGTVLEGTDGVPQLQTWTVRLVKPAQRGSR